jgi:hypothetical protein
MLFTRIDDEIDDVTDGKILENLPLKSFWLNLAFQLTICFTIRNLLHFVGRELAIKGHVERETKTIVIIKNMQQH